MEARIRAKPRRGFDAQHDSATGRASLAGDAQISQSIGIGQVPQSRSGDDGWGTDKSGLVLYAVKRRIHQGRT